MAAIDDFTPQELQLIQHAPVFVIAGAVASEPSGMTGAMREMIDGVEGFAASMARADDSLLTEIFRAIDQTQPDDFDIEEVSNEDNREALMERGIASGVEAHALIAARARQEDAAAYAEALMRAASAAVRAAKTGGLLGFGAEVITDSEAEYVQRLATSLGYEQTIS